MGLKFFNLFILNNFIKKFGFRIIIDKSKKLNELHAKY